MIINIQFYVLTSNPESFVNLFLFFTNFSLFVMTEFVLIKEYIISLAVTAVLGFFYKRLQFLRVEVPNI